MHIAPVRSSPLPCSPPELGGPSIIQATDAAKDQPERRGAGLRASSCAALFLDRQGRTPAGLRDDIDADAPARASMMRLISIHVMTAEGRAA